MTKTFTAEQTEGAFEVLEAKLRYANDVLVYNSEVEENELRDKPFAELAEIVGQSEEEIRANFETNGTLL